ncbi:T-box transcription factor T homolog [Corticium candelabrum]|uniref:T-box transcription factor T homolog n=1 Tax=Corticium candelabrum TaxID=121492 RepID=UPI002E260935|nr:T-box transcription factor T homolog [Corticium candelabrum]
MPPPGHFHYNPFHPSRPIGYRPSTSAAAASTTTAGVVPPVTNAFSSNSSSLDEGWSSGTCIEVVLKEFELWQKFSKIGTEMIITKSGRQLFPLIVVSVTNLEKDSVYKVVLEFACNDRRRYKFIKSQWVSSQQSDATFPDQDPSFVHPDSPATGKHWMKQVISFKAAKLTNDKDCRKPTHCAYMCACG